MVKFFSVSWLAVLLIGWTLSLPNTEKEISLEAEITGCGNTLHLYQFDGFGFSEVFSATGENDVFRFKVPESDSRFYYIGPSERNAVPVILGQEPAIKVKGNCRQLRQLEFTGSPINDGYRELKEKMESFNQQNSEIIRSLQRVRGDEAQSEGLLSDLKKLDDERLDFLNQLKEENPLFASIVSLNTYLSFPHHGEGYDNELGYYAEEFFRFANFKDDIYAYIPWTYESFKGYVTTLSTVGLPDDAHLMYIEKSLNLLPSASPAQKLAYAGALAALKQKSHNNYVHFAEQFIERFREVDPQLSARLKKELEITRNLMIGGTAPDFSQETPEGQLLTLSELRGKVVLIDFWASWCGPCRKENPNVVRVYEKYKGEGFDILSVSLDNKRDRWLKAIEQDGLEWHHVSDLQGWGNEVAQTYGVHSIPHTILLDQDGKILARNLRGRSLEAKLAELFGQ